MRDVIESSRSQVKRAFAPKRALARGIAAALALAALSAAAGGCAGSSGDYWRERPSSSNYTRVPIR